MEDFYARFTLEKQYLNNVSPTTVASYRWAWKAFENSLKGKHPSALTKETIIARIAELRSRNLSAVTINTYLRSLNTFFRWLHAEGHSPTLLVIPKLREQQKVLETFDDTQIKRMIHFTPKSRAERRIHLLTCLLLDTGARIDEALSINRIDDVDLDNLLLKIHGKGRKDRVVPFSLNLRKSLFRLMASSKPAYGDLLFFSGQGQKLNQRNALRAFKGMCKRLRITGVRCSFHTLRHTFATKYLRNGGDVLRLQRILGHENLEMTRRYVNLQTADLQAVHHRFSPLAAGSRK